MEPLQMNEKTAPELPQGWVWTTLGKIATWGSGGTPLKSKYRYYGGDIPWLKIGDLNEGLVFTSEVTITKDGLENSSAKWVEKGSLLVAMYGSIGKLGIAGINLTTNQAIAFTKLDESLLNTKFVFWYIRSIRSDLFNQSKGATQKNISQTVLKQINFPLPPLPEQHRIVTKIEELFTQLDAGVSSLKKTQAQLKQYRQSVLKSACEGKLVPTEAELARAEGREYEPADVLLERILKKRRENWEEEQKRKGKKSAKYKEPAAPDVGGFGELPEGWIWGGIDHISKYIIDCLHSTAKFVQDGKYCVDTNCIEQGKIIFGKARFVSEETYRERVSRLTPQTNDILFAREGTIGTAVIVPPNIELCLGQRMMMFRAANGIFPFYFMWALQSRIFEKQWKAQITGSTVPHVNIGDIKLMALPLPPTTEQHRIVAEIERRLSVADGIEKTIEQSLKQAERLRQSILKKAFEGKLVAQNPDDEPASVLFERIREEKAKVEAETKKKRKSKAKKNTKEK